MAFPDDVNRILRDHFGYTGDGRGGVGALPIGDRSTERKPIDKKELRELLIIMAQTMGDPGALQEIINGLDAKADLTDLRNGRVWVSSAATPGGTNPPPGTDRILANNFGSMQYWMTTANAEGAPASETLQLDATGQWWFRAFDGRELSLGLASKADLSDLRNGRVFGSGFNNPSGQAIPLGTNRVIAQAGGGQQIWGRTTAPTNGLETDTLKLDAAGVWWVLLFDSLAVSPQVSGVITRTNSLEQQAVPAWWGDTAASAGLASRRNFPASFIIFSASGLRWYERNAPTEKGSFAVIGEFGNANYGLRGRLPFDLDVTIATVQGAVSTLQTRIGEEEAARSLADESLQDQIDALTISGGALVTAATVSEGMAATSSGEYFMVISASASGFYRNVSGSAQALYQFVGSSELAARPAIFVNREQAELATIAPSARGVSVAQGRKVLPYVDAEAFSSPALITNGGRRWNPAEEWTASHFGVLADGSADDTAAMLLARDAMQERGGGILRLPRGRIEMNAGLLWAFNNFQLVGEGETATILDLNFGGRFSVGTCFDFALFGFSVLNSTDGIVIGEDQGAQQYAASFTAERLATNFSQGRGFSVGMAYMADLANIRAQNAAGIGMDFSSGLKTSISMRNSHALDCGGDGWKIKNADYCHFTTLGADRNGGYGYHLENLNAVDVFGGAEDNAKAALHFHFDLGTTDVTKKFNGVRVGMFEKSNNPSVQAGGQFAHFTCSAASADAGAVEFVGCSNFIPPTGPNVAIDGGKYEIIWPRGNSLARVITGGAYSIVTDGATGRKVPAPVTITSPNTPIATLKSAMANGVVSYGGELLVYVSRNPLSQGSKAATYKLLISRSAGDAGTVSITPVAQDGRTTGAASDEASFTFLHNRTTGQLLASPVGTASGAFYFHFYPVGNLEVDGV